MYVVNKTFRAGEGDGGAPLARPDQSRDELEAALIADLTPAMNQFITDLVAYLLSYHDSLTAAAPFVRPTGPDIRGLPTIDPRHFEKADALWNAALKATMPPGTYEIFQNVVPPGVRNAITEVVTSMAAHSATRVTRASLKRTFLPPSQSFVEGMARTEATTRWNKRYLTNAKRGLTLQKLTGTEQATFKRWVSRDDERTRHTHAEADGQIVLLNEPFTVGGHSLQHPGDPTAPAGERINCRCVMEIFQPKEAEAMKLLLASGAEGDTWNGVLVFEGEATGDGRLIENDALYWDEGGAPLRMVLNDVGGHDGAVVVGRITDMWRGESGAIEAKGFIDLGSESGLEARRLIAANLMNGVSVDLDDVSFEVRVKSELLGGGEGGEESMSTPVDEEGRETLLEVNSGDEMMIVKAARIRAATLVAIPAFAGARIDLDDAAATTDVTAEETSAAAASTPAEPFVIVASAHDDAPPADWFTDPQLREPTALTVTADGRVYGHLATWKTEHIARPGTTPPRSASGYKYFHTGALITDDGKQIAVGRLTVGTGHAGDNDAPLKAMSHYDNTGSAVADVRAGEDAHGIWVAGAVRPTASDDQIRELRASPLSGDWRRIAGSLELVAALAVNTAGFPIPRGLVASGHVQFLLTSTALHPRLPDEDMDALRRMAHSYLRAEKKQHEATLSHARRVKQQLTLQRAQRVAQQLER